MTIVALNHDRIDVEAYVEDGQQDDGDEAPSRRDTDDGYRGEEDEGDQMGSLRKSGPFLEPSDRSHETIGTIEDGMPAHSVRVEISARGEVPLEPTYAKPLVDDSLVFPGSKVTSRD